MMLCDMFFFWDGDCDDNSSIEGKGVSKTSNNQSFYTYTGRSAQGREERENEEDARAEGDEIQTFQDFRFLSVRGSKGGTKRVR